MYHLGMVSISKLCLQNLFRVRARGVFSLPDAYIGYARVAKNSQCACHRKIMPARPFRRILPFLSE